MTVERKRFFADIFSENGNVVLFVKANRAKTKPFTHLYASKPKPVSGLAI